MGHTGHVNIILEVETDLGRKLFAEEIAGISSVSTWRFFREPLGPR